MLFSDISNSIEDDNKFNLNQKEHFNFDIDKENNTYRSEFFYNNDNKYINKGMIEKNEEEIEEEQLKEVINKKLIKNEIEESIKEINKYNENQIIKNEIKDNKIKLEYEKEKVESDEDSIIPIDTLSNAQ